DRYPSKGSTSAAARVHEQWTQGGGEVRERRGAPDPLRDLWRGSIAEATSACRDAVPTPVGGRMNTETLRRLGIILGVLLLVWVVMSLARHAGRDTEQR